MSQYDFDVVTGPSTKSSSPTLSAGLSKSRERDAEPRPKLRPPGAGQESEPAE
jgi:hypothetical protein